MSDLFHVVVLSIVVIMFLVGIILYQHLAFMNQIQLLVDKVMSRSFSEYIRAKDPVPKIKIENEVPEDLRSLQEFQLS